MALGIERKTMAEQSISPANRSQRRSVDPQEKKHRTRPTPAVFL